MIQQFNVGDKVKYTSPYPCGTSCEGVVLEVNVQGGIRELGYIIKWEDGSRQWITDGNITLIERAVKVEPTIQSVKEAKVALESEILRLIQDFNKKTDLEVQRISLDCYRAISGGYTYQVNVKVEI